MPSKKLAKSYDHREREDTLYRMWEQSGFFNPDSQTVADSRGNVSRKSAFAPSNDGVSQHPSAFTVIMPPPNANGSLHLGHALYCLQDIMVRYHRMKGDRTLYLPGADHAGFETQVVYDKKLEKEGRRRSEIPREQLWQEIWDFTQHNKKTMEAQLRKLGMSCDWSRERFTLDPEIVKIVYHTFQRLYEDGLVYRENRIVNWCTKHQTTLSDLEVKHVERQDPLYYIQYGPLTLATVRLETKFGDTAVAVHPKDKRYKALVGKEIKITTLLGPAKIKVIADEAVDPKFGTGAVKVTPAHDPNDFEIWKRHAHEIPGPRAVIDQYGRMDLVSRFPSSEAAKKYHGLKVLEARKVMEVDMQAQGLMVKIYPTYTHNVATCYKCGTTVEPRILPQWYVAMTKAPHPTSPPLGKGRKKEGSSLRDMAVEAVKKGKIAFVPKRMEKTFMHWMKNLRDWNISRQIVWGIRIPAWFHAPLCIPKPGVPHEEMGKCKEIVISETEPVCEFCDAKYAQDPDVFDTWFSSGQWPFATLLASGRTEQGTKNKEQKLPWSTEDFEQFYPTTVMETGWDILFFWVARMVMLGLYATGKAPFHTVYLHGLVRDKDRQKMSKSKGNVIDPLGVIDLYGADALRMALVVGNTAGNDIIISEEKIKGYRNFANKIWNAARFVIENLPREAPPTQTLPLEGEGKGRGRSPAAQKGLTPADKKILKELDSVVKKVTRDLDAFKFHHAGETLYHYFWHTFCDKIIEEMKPRLGVKKIPSPRLEGEGKSEGDPSTPSLRSVAQDDKDREAARYILSTILVTCLKLLHPFMPFVTEAVWQEFYKGERMLITEEWPTART